MTCANSYAIFPVYNDFQIVHCIQVRFLHCAGAFFKKRDAGIAANRFRLNRNTKVLNVLNLLVDRLADKYLRQDARMCG